MEPRTGRIGRLKAEKTQKETELVYDIQKRFQNSFSSLQNSFGFFVNQAFYKVKYLTKKSKEFSRHDKEFLKLKIKNRNIKCFKILF